MGRSSLVTLGSAIQRLQLNRYPIGGMLQVGAKIVELKIGSHLLLSPNA